MLFYSTGFRSGVSKRNNLSGTGLLRMGVNCIKFLDSNMVQFAFWGKNKYPTNIRITLTDMVYDNLKAVYIKAVQNGSQKLFNDGHKQLIEQSETLSVYIQTITGIKDIRLHYFKGLRLTIMAQRYQAAMLLCYQYKFHYLQILIELGTELELGN